MTNIDHQPTFIMYLLCFHARSLLQQSEFLLNPQKVVKHGKEFTFTLKTLAEKVFSAPITLLTRSGQTCYLEY